MEDLGQVFSWRHSRARSGSFTLNLPPGQKKPVSAGNEVKAMGRQQILHCSKDAFLPLLSLESGREKLIMIIIVTHSEPVPAKMLTHLYTGKVLRRQPSFTKYIPTDGILYIQDLRDKSPKNLLSKQMQSRQLLASLPGSWLTLSLHIVPGQLRSVRPRDAPGAGTKKASLRRQTPAAFPPDASPFISLTINCQTPGSRQKNTTGKKTVYWQNNDF